MGKVDVSKIVADMRKLYAKDKKAHAIISTGASVKQDYTEADGVALPANNIIREILSLPCLPFNKLVQVAGMPDTGKSTTGGEIMAAAQKQGFTVVLWDSEDKMDAARFKNHFGGSPDDLLLVKTNEILKGAELVRKYITAIKDQDASAKILFVWDSVGGSQSRSHAERDLDDEKHAAPGTDARENSQVMKMLVGLINKYPDSIAIYLVNQVYAKIGFMQHGEKESGGNKIYFHSSAIIILKRIKVLTKTVNKRKVKYGILTRATVTKNHLTPSETSVHQMDFQITAKGASVTESSADEEAEDNE